MRESWRWTGEPPVFSRTAAPGSAQGAGPTAQQKLLGSLKHWLTLMLAEPWLCRKRKARGRMFFTLLSSPRRLRLSNWVHCPATDLGIKPLFVRVTLSLPVLSIICGAVLWVCLCYRDLLTALVASDCQTWMWATACPSWYLGYAVHFLQEPRVVFGWLKWATCWPRIWACQCELWINTGNKLYTASNIFYCFMCWKGIQTCCSLL